MGNNDACKVIVFGVVKVNMYDDIIRTFGNVQHVPALKKNLISLGTLDTSDLTYSSSGGKIKICKSSLVIMRGEKLSNNLYKLMEIPSQVELLYPHWRSQRMTRPIYGTIVLAI